MRTDNILSTNGKEEEIGVRGVNLFATQPCLVQQGLGFLQVFNCSRECCTPVDKTYSYIPLREMSSQIAAVPCLELCSRFDSFLTGEH